MVPPLNHSMQCGLFVLACFLFLPSTQDGLAGGKAEREYTKRFEQDDIVRILTGAWRGQTGKVISSSKKLTKLNVAAFGRRIEATVPTGSLAPR